MIQIKIDDAIYTLKDGRWMGNNLAVDGVLQILNRQQTGLAKDYYHLPSHLKENSQSDFELYCATEISAFVGGEIITETVERP